ncbi:hypothetical protein NHX12_029010 [Muraenolepis orangiensis]|uniref:Uncharacterized protein n=1 Tax=Muraenolepis orangiensis TaxID=630683 RepID=A0A9Q0IMP5_9TELE|nr:hypothetical protein NHX12_029010 [Muraenolepis orangiensis]
MRVWVTWVSSEPPSSSQRFNLAEAVYRPVDHQRRLQLRLRTFGIRSGTFSGESQVKSFQVSKVSKVTNPVGHHGIRSHRTNLEPGTLEEQERRGRSRRGGEGAGEEGKEQERRGRSRRGRGRSRRGGEGAGEEGKEQERRGRSRRGGEGAGEEGKEQERVEGGGVGGRRRSRRGGEGAGEEGKEQERVEGEGREEGGGWRGRGRRVSHDVLRHTTEGRSSQEI